MYNIFAMKKNKEKTRKKYIQEFITDKKGKKVGVVLALEKFDELMEDLQDLAMIADRKDDELMSYNQFELNLKNHGKL
ncbi:hypothetical protein OAR19_00365 [bacterium]|nr:hypothetical protein [bacterium]